MAMELGSLVNRENKTKNYVLNLRFLFLCTIPFLIYNLFDRQFMHKSEAKPAVENEKGVL